MKMLIMGAVFLVVFFIALMALACAAIAAEADREMEVCLEIHQ